MGADPELELPAEHIAQQGHVAQVGQKTPARLVIGVADIVAGLHGLASQFATTGHRMVPYLEPRGCGRLGRASWFARRPATEMKSGVAIKTARRRVKLRRPPAAELPQW